MGIVQIARAAAADPVEGWYLVYQRLAPGRMIDRLERLGAEQGLTGPHFLLSFDCDTDRDAAVAWEVHARLLEMGIRAIYAVPGELLERGMDTWQRIGRTGAEFLNHGYLEHTVYRDGRYTSTLFYDRMTPAEIEKDIRRGHETVTKVIGRAPQGFRTPHFGTFRTPRQIGRLHDLLARLGYRFSTSTTPYIALRNGPLTHRFGIVEVPVSGCPDFPMTILDSYTFRFTPGRHGPADYVAQARLWAEELAQGRRLLVNLYADPSQVADWLEFFAAMQALAPFARGSYADVLGGAAA